MGVDIDNKKFQDAIKLHNQISQSECKHKFFYTHWNENITIGNATCLQCKSDLGKVSPWWENKPK